MSIGTIELHSLSHLAATLQRTPKVIRTAAERLEIVPAMRLDDTPFFDAEQAALLADHFRDIDAKRNA